MLYDVTRNEFDGAKSAQEDYMPGITGLNVQLWGTADDANGNPIVTGTGAIEQHGINILTGLDCARPDSLRGTNAIQGSAVRSHSAPLKVGIATAQL